MNLLKTFHNGLFFQGVKKIINNQKFSKVQILFKELIFSFFKILFLLLNLKELKLNQHLFHHY